MFFSENHVAIEDHRRIGLLLHREVSLDERIAGLGGGADARQFFLQRQPTGRFGSADEIASLALYLASDEAAFTTGTVNVIDGGWSV